MKSFGSISYDCTKKLILSLIAFTLASVGTSCAQSFSMRQVTPKDLMDFDVGNVTVPMFTFNVTAASERDYLEGREPYINAAGQLVGESASFSPEFMKHFRVVITQRIGTKPPIGTILIYRKGQLVAACNVVGSKLDARSKEVAPSVINQSTAFEFSLAPDMIEDSKFEIQSTLSKSSSPQFSDCILYWFYIKDFIPNE